MATPSPSLLLLEILLNGTVSYCDVSAAALYVWDYLITFDMEVEFVWKSKRSFIKYLFLVQRYLPFIDVVVLFPYQILGRNLTVLECQQLETTLGYISMSGVVLSELLLALRVWAVWNRALWPTIILGLSFVTLWTLAYVYTHQYISWVEFGPPFIPGFHGCSVLRVKNDLHLCFVVIMVWDIVTLIFMIIPGIMSYHSGGNSALFHVVYRDGVIYYMYLVLSSTLNIVSIRTFTKPEHIFLSIQRALHAILASRVLLHIRRTAKDETEVLSSETEMPTSEHISDPTLGLVFSRELVSR